MSSAQNLPPRRARAGARRGLSLFVLTLLAVEFLDELVFGVREAAWPLIRDDLRLSYTQVGVILSVPPIVGHLVEPAARRPRRRVAQARARARGRRRLRRGDAARGLEHELRAAARGVDPVEPRVGRVHRPLAGDADGRRARAARAEHGALGAGGLGGELRGAGGRRRVRVGGRELALGLRRGGRADAAGGRGGVASAVRDAFGPGRRTRRARRSSKGLRGALRALRRRAVLRWLVLLQLGDFTYDVLRGFLALYFVDVVGAGEGGAALAVAVWTWVGLAGDFAVVPLLERVRGLRYLRVSTSVVLVLFPLMLLAEGFSTKLVLLGLLGFANAGLVRDHQGEALRRDAGAERDGGDDSGERLRARGQPRPARARRVRRSVRARPDDVAARARAGGSARGAADGERTKQRSGSRQSAPLDER